MMAESVGHEEHIRVGARRRLARPRILFASAEIYPLAKTGGLADVCAALPMALARLGAEVRLFMPGYESALDTVLQAQVEVRFHDLLGRDDASLIRGCMPDSGLPVWLLDCPPLFRRPGTPYQDPGGEDWPDNALRYGMFCHAAARTALGQPGLAWRPDVLHGHDWHAGLTPLLVARHGRPRPRTVFTIHNAAFQGNFPLDVAERVGLPADLLGPEGVEFFGKISFLKAGIAFADRITTVSPTYAREICTPEFGCGLDGLLRSRAQDLVGVLNGIDTTLWDPETDEHLAARYSRADRRGKTVCKADLQCRLGLRPDPAAPLAVMVSRLTPQKMADVVLAELPSLLQRHPALQFAALGRGARSIEDGLRGLTSYFPERLAVQIGYTEPEAHRLHAGADLLVHGSRFEPCGLSQLYAMRYGTVPIVRRIGGLADSVVDDEDPGCRQRPATGFSFDAATGAALVQTVDRCLETHAHDPGRWSALQDQAMEADFGWSRSARAYWQVYSDTALPPQARSGPQCEARAA